MSAFYGLPIETLKELQAAYLAALKALATSSSYEMTDGVLSRRLTRADLPDVKETLCEINGEIARLERTNLGRTAYADFTYFDL
ncbi:MAG: hypothetical protein DMF62_03250 [Acidobacteria bacterium]|nr:MAG: hypothetical protein DMF62_03250 [Acidobacteriota bacterium]PYT00188.1 MAG: hypothetical protein DMF63_08400 [Acidobacteriota bacterium]